MFEHLIKFVPLLDKKFCECCGQEEDEGGDCKNEICAKRNGLPYTTYGCKIEVPQTTGEGRSNFTTNQ